jgi:two-component system LytT family response regulator
MSIRVLIADDQPLARERLAALLADEPDVRVIASAASGLEAVEAVETRTPDLVFLDMQMPELDGLGVIEAVGPERMPPTIFVTAYDRYALKAFELHAIDYLLKPFGRLRFQQALARARERIDGRRAGVLADRLMALIDTLRPSQADRPATTRSSARFVVRAGGRMVFVEPAQIDWIEAEGNYVRLHVGPAAYLVRDTMSAVLERLGASHFFRVHRSAIVQIDRIRELRLASGGDYDVVLHDGREIPLSRLYKDALQERLARGGEGGIRD